MNVLFRRASLAVFLSIAVAGCTEQSVAPAADSTAATAVDASSLKVVSWGPKTTKAGVAFNMQPDGNSGIFAEMSGEVPHAKFEGTIGGKPLSGVVASGKVVTATIPKDFLATAGAYPVELTIPSQNVHIAVGDFIVEGDGQASGAAHDSAAPASAPADGAAPPVTPAGSTPATPAP